MNCQRIEPYLPAYVGGDLSAAESMRIEQHLGICESCRAQFASLELVRGGLGSLRERDVEPPVYLLDALLDDVRGYHRRRFIPLPPVPPHELLQTISEHRDVILSAMGAAVLVAGAGYAFWRASRGVRTQPEPAR
jgi:putative zinc finger protein